MYLEMFSEERKCGWWNWVHRDYEITVLQLLAAHWTNQMSARYESRDSHVENSILADVLGQDG